MAHPLCQLIAEKPLEHVHEHSDEHRREYRPFSDSHELPEPEEHERQQDRYEDESDIVDDLHLAEAHLCLQAQYIYEVIPGKHSYVSGDRQGDPQAEDYGAVDDHRPLHPVLFQDYAGKKVRVDVAKDAEHYQGDQLEDRLHLEFHTYHDRAEGHEEQVEHQGGLAYREPIYPQAAHEWDRGYRRRPQNGHGGHDDT